MVSKEFMAIIDEDISKCTSEIEKGDKKSRGELHSRLISKYGKIIDGFSNDLSTLFYDDTGEVRKKNLETMRQKLELFKAMGYENKYSDHDKAVVFNNSNEIKVKFNLSFSEARNSVEEMTSLNEDEISEIISKIDELEKIVNSKERKTQKWARAKNIIKWVADKGVDVGITLLPLIMKIGE